MSPPGFGFGVRPAARRRFSSSPTPTPTPDPTYWQTSAPVDAAGSAALLYPWTGDFAADGAAITIHTTAEAAAVRIVVSEDATLATGRYYWKSPVATSHLGLAKTAMFRLQGLLAGKTYYYAPMIDNVVDTSKIGKFVTLDPLSLTSFEFAYGGCYQPDPQDDSFNYIAASNAKFFLGLGDSCYGDKIADAAAQYHLSTAFEMLLGATNSKLGKAAAMYRTLPTLQMWSDHDFVVEPGGANGANDVNGGWLTANSRGSEIASNIAFARALWPNPVGVYSGATEPIYWKKRTGSMLIVASDQRSQATINTTTDSTTKTRHGATQLAQMLNDFAYAKEQGLTVCWMTEVPPIENDYFSGDGWYGFNYERYVICDFIQRIGLDHGQLFAIASDVHWVSLDDGTNCNYDLAGAGHIPSITVGTMYPPSNDFGTPPYSHGYSDDVSGTYNTRGTWGHCNHVVNGDNSVTITLTAKRPDGSTQLSDVSSTPATSPMTCNWTVSAAQMAPAGAKPWPHKRPVLSGKRLPGATLTGAIPATFCNSPTGITWSLLHNGSVVAGPTSTTAGASISTTIPGGASNGDTIVLRVTSTNAAGTINTDSRTMTVQTLSGATVYDGLADTIATGSPAHTGESGHTWAVQNASGSYAFADMACLYLITGGSGIEIKNSWVPGSADYYVQADFVYRNKINSTGGNGAWLFARWASFRNEYVAGFNPATQKWTIGKKAGSNTITVLAAAAATSSFTYGETHTVKFDLSGTTLTLYVDGVSVCSVTDSTYSAAGSVGLTNTVAASTDAAGWAFRNFKAA